MVRSIDLLFDRQGSFVQEIGILEFSLGNIMVDCDSKSDGERKAVRIPTR